MSQASALWAHLLAGSTGLLLYWCALLATKGSPIHEAAGRAFFVALVGVVATVGLLVLTRSGSFHPASLIQFAYLSLCVVTVTTVGWTAVRWKASPDRFRGLHFKLLGPAIFFLGMIVLAAGLASGDPHVAVVSWVGLAYGGAMIRFARLREPLHRLWWMNWHLNAVCGLFTAVHGTLLFVGWRWAIDPEAGRGTGALFQGGVLVVAVAMRLWFGRRRGVPLRFTAEPPDSRTTGAAAGASS